jgi:hypothetical protein
MSFEDDCNQWYSIKGDEVMGYCYGALGDSFAMFSYSVLCGIRFKKPMLLSIKGGGKKESNFRKFMEIVESPESIQFTDLDATPFDKLFCTRKHKDPYCKLKKMWEGNTNGKVCYHYDRLTGHKRAERFPTEAEEKHFLNRMEEIEAINISYPMPLDEVVDVASKCSRFIGIESGISHIMHAVGIPVTLRNWNGKWANNKNKVEMYHPNKQYNLVKDFYSV